MLARDEIEVNKDGGSTPLYIACHVGHTEIVTMLLARGEIGVNQACTDDGATPLYATCFNGHFEIGKLLLACGEIEVNQVSPTAQYFLQWPPRYSTALVSLQRKLDCY